MNGSDIKVEFARAVKSWRDKLGISQEKLAERADLHRTYISDVERGARNPSLTSITKLAKALDVSVSVLFAPCKPAESHQVKLAAGEEAKELVEVLLVEDNEDDIELTLQAFKKARFANVVHVVRDGAEALDFLFARGTYASRGAWQKPRIVLLDLNLPKVSGVDVLRRIKGDARTMMIPVVVLTASHSDWDFATCRRMGAETYMVKPVDFQRLCEVTPALNLTWALIKPEPPCPPQDRIEAS